MVCIRKKNPKIHTQEHKLCSNDTFRESTKLQTHAPRSISRSGFKTSKKESENTEDGEFAFAITLWKEELLNHDNCTWLSLGDASYPSSCSKDNGLSSCMDLKIDAWFISLLSTNSPTHDTFLDTKTTFFDGSRVNPMEEASLILDQRKVLDEYIVFQEHLEEEEVVSSLSWLENESCNGQTLDKKSKSKSKRAYFDSGDDEHSLFSSSFSSDYSSEIMDLEDISVDKPLFWPFNSASDWGSEYKQDFLIMSPCKKDGNSPKGKNMVAEEVDRLTEKYERKHKIVLEDLLLVDKLNVEGVIIEQVLGLGEFDGHEGVEYEFNIDHFSIV
ncbi:hypothetical protein HanOQP8_Chr07g0237491 [Helianthus annuus]|nr:hypothetical protein HanLR1_Chr07g0229591 [Helianthus annuus]KAJ0730214.1 hypothetical protein HanOQP8_Chr07g0237491 [Helianthus annuus]